MKRISVFCGHYGSGKTNIAVNYALKLKKSFDKVAIADLDIVNPYFRTKDSAKMLSESGVRVISSPYANTNVDTPALPAEIYSVTDDESVHGVIDVGGDDRGATALGRYAEAIDRAGGCEMYFVINMYRPLTRTVKDTVEVFCEIEKACHMRFCAIVNNSNIGEATRPEDVLKSVEYAKGVSEAVKLPTAFTCVKKELYPAMAGKLENIMPIELFVRQSWEERKE